MPNLLKNNFMKSIILTTLAFFGFIVLSAQGTGCPQVEAGPDLIIPCTQTTANLNASVFNVGETTTYGVSAIAHAPPIAYSAGGGTAVSVNTDDVWSGVVNLPFPFCFFGQTYNSCLIGSNGAISFNVASAGGYHPWPFSASVPSTALTTGGNIFGPYHDIDPSVAGSVQYHIMGAAPCRTFVVSYNSLAHYDCTNLRSTHMMVLYETTNVIEVYVNNKQTCNSWNSGNTVIGIQNAAGSAGYAAPGRNTGNWTITTPEAWQFAPTGVPIYSAIEWFQGATSLGTGSAITVSPSGSTTTYTARTTYTRCDGLQIPVEDDVVVNFDGVNVSVTPSNTFTCAGANTTLTASSPTATSYSWSPGGLTGAIVNVSPTTTTTYTVTATNSANGCTATASATINVAQPVSTACNVLYVTPTGSPSGAGTKASPFDLITALEAGACNGTIIKMAVGDYITDTTITKITSFVTLEGGFNPSINWDKVSTAGATRIMRTATQTTSLVSGSGINNETGPQPEVVAIEMNAQDGFRFQDITIETSNLGGGSTYAGYQGVDVIGLRLNNCSDYNLVRTQVIPGSASNGADQIFTIPATNGGDAVGIQLTSNGANTNILNSSIIAGATGNGGIGGGSNGTSTNISYGGLPFVVDDNAFNLSSQPLITMDDISCTATDIDFTGLSSANWSFDVGSTPPNATGVAVVSQYASLGRKNISYGSNIYTGFANIILDDQVNPLFTTSAPLVNGQYKICAGESVAFNSTNGGVGYTYNWNLGGGSVPNTFTGTQYEDLSGVVFNTPGVYTISLSYETNCCGISSTETLDIYVEEQPLAIMPNDTAFCAGAPGGVALTVGGGTAGGTIMWSPAAGLSSTTDFSVVALPASTTTYSVLLTDSSGVCSSTGSVTVTVNDLVLDSLVTPASCIADGTAMVTVSGGSGNYSYAWNNGDMTQTITTSQSGVYSVLLTDLVTGCQDSISMTIPPGPGAFLGNLIIEHSTCAGDSNGSAIVESMGGTPPYVYDWSHLAATIPTMNSSDTVSNLSPGSYSVTVTDLTGCDFTLNFIIDEPGPLNFGVDTVAPPTCIYNSDGFIEIRVDGGTRPYTYSWTNGAPFSVVNDVVFTTGLPVGMHTFLVVDSAGCSDSITFDLNVSALTGNFDTTLCFGQSITINGSVYDTSVVNAVEVIPNAGPNSCDSTLTFNITVLDLIVENVDTSICQGQSLTFNGMTYTSTGIYNDTIGYVASNCDSVQYIINLQIDSFTIENIDTTICQGQSLIFNGMTYTSNGIYNDTLGYVASGCDSVQYVIDLAIDSFLVENIDTTICQGQSFMFNGVTYTSSGLYNNTLPYAASGCDSIKYVINLAIDSFTIENIDTTICQGQSLTVNGVTYSANGMYNDTANYVNTGCDSVQYIINLQIDSFIIENIDTTICQGQSININLVTYTESGLYFDTATYAASGCDFFQYVINLQIDSFIIENIDTTICQGQSLSVNGVTYTSSGVYNDTLAHAASGCDSVQYVIDLTIDSFLVENIDTTICQGQSLTVNGVTYTTNGSYLDTAFFTLSACDSIQYSIDLSIDSFIIENIDTTICQGQSLTVNGVTYTANGLYTDTASYVSSACDSIQYVIDLQIDSFTIVNIDTILCFGESIDLNGVNYDATGFYQDTLSYPLSGCDQIQYNLTLLILNEKLGLIDTAICDGESIDVNGTSYNSTVQGAQEVFVVGPQNCDSTVTINLLVNPLPNLSASANPDTIFLDGTAELIANGTGDFEWEGSPSDSIIVVDPTVDMSYSVFLTDSNGCVSESTVTVFVIGAGLDQIVVPDAFSPNGDEINEIFRVVTDQYFADIEMIIYNRWGDIIHRENGSQNHGWDGTFNGDVQPTEVYVYLIKLLTFDDQEFILSGNVTLIR
ncbi:MAG: gliding motility-associated-like protein [Chitinophagales bacterium]|jgi:gliding motility-associated-like protein